MSDGCAEMLAAARTFLRQLERNDDRDWFEAHKLAFESYIEAPMKLLADSVAEDLLRLTGVTHSGKVGRIYRDVRFWKDKSPFNIHVHAHWTPSGGTEPGWLFHLDSAETKLMLWLHTLKADGLSRYRSAMDREGKEVHAIIETGRAQVAELVDFGDSILKRAPKPN